MASLSARETAKQAMPSRPSRTGQNHFPPPNAVPDYVSRNLPPLPPKPSSTSSSIYDSDESSRRPTPSRFHRHDSSGSHHNQSRVGSTVGEFEGSIDEDGMAMVRPPGMSIVTDFNQSDRSYSGDRQSIIYSPRPKYPDHKLVKDLVILDRSEVSPIMSPPTGTFSYQTHEVSPLTPGGTSIRGLEYTISEPDVNAQRWAAGSGQNSRRQSHWEDIPPAASHSSLGFYPVSTEEARRRSIPKNQAPQFRHSDPGSPTDGAGATALNSAAPNSYLKAPSRNPNRGPRPRSEHAKTALGRPTPDTSSQGIMASPYSLWTRGYGQTRPSPAPSSSSRVSFAVKETPSFSGRSSANSKPRPESLHLHEGKTADEHIKTPYPEILAPQSSWDYDDDDDDEAEKNRPERSSWGKTSIKSSKTEAESTKAKGGGVGKFMSRVKHAGGDVISKLTFTSEESKREKRIEELRGKIQHHSAAAHNGQVQML
ncbi:hypothetical protein AB5N19_05482 [Seiridium cardinale]|uniref:Uncharacterized protein n=1 Tax=Seiridium cardinale TaxID=138064 RepID=A0ABR2XIQ0_9PEZI